MTIPSPDQHCQPAMADYGAGGRGRSFRQGRASLRTRAATRLACSLFRVSTRGGGCCDWQVTSHSTFPCDRGPCDVSECFAWASGIRRDFGSSRPGMKRGADSAIAAKPSDRPQVCLVCNQRCGSARRAREHVVVHKSVIQAVGNGRKVEELSKEAPVVTKQPRLAFPLAAPAVLDAAPAGDAPGAPAADAPDAPGAAPAPGAGDAPELPGLRHRRGWRAGCGGARACGAEGRSSVLVPAGLVAGARP